jgi:MYXO-CTERM domain-containing protein
LARLSARIIAALLALTAASARAASTYKCPHGPAGQWKKTTEPGVVVTCGLKDGVSGKECEEFRVFAKGKSMWNAVADEQDYASIVRTMKRGEVLFIGEAEVRIFTPGTMHKGTRKLARPHIAMLLSELTEEERARVPRYDCPIFPVIQALRPDTDPDMVRVDVVQRWVDDKGRVQKELPPVELKMSISMGTVVRVTPLPKAQQPPPRPEPVAAAPQPLVIPQPEVPKPDDGRPADRPTANPGLGKPPPPAFKEKEAPWYSCSTAPGGAALALSTLVVVAMRRRRNVFAQSTQKTPGG